MLGLYSARAVAAVVLRMDPAFPVLSPEEVSAGLAAPSAAAVILGQSGQSYLSHPYMAHLG